MKTLTCDVKKTLITFYIVLFENSNIDITLTRVNTILLLAVLILKFVANIEWSDHILFFTRVSFDQFTHFTEKTVRVYNFVLKSTLDVLGSRQIAFIQMVRPCC